MGKAHDNKCIEDLTFVSPSPCYTAALLSALFRDSAIKEKDRANDLLAMGDVCEELNKDLVAIGKRFYALDFNSSCKVCLSLYPCLRWIDQ